MTTQQAIEELKDLMRRASSLKGGRYYKSAKNKSTVKKEATRIIEEWVKENL
jgi:hypothetical protein